MHSDDVDVDIDELTCNDDDNDDDDVFSIPSFPPSRGYANLKIIQCNEQASPKLQSHTHTHIHTHTLSLSLSHTPKTDTKIPTANVKGAHPSISYIHPYSFLPSLLNHRRPLTHRNPHLNIMPVLPIFITSPIIRISRGTIRKIIQIQLPMHRRLDIAASVVLWRVPTATTKVGAGRRGMMQQGRAEGQGSIVFEFIGVGFGVGEGFFEFVRVGGVVGFRVGFLLAVEGEAGG